MVAVVEIDRSSGIRIGTIHSVGYKKALSITRSEDVEVGSVFHASAGLSRKQLGAVLAELSPESVARLRRELDQLKVQPAPATGAPLKKTFSRVMKAVGVGAEQTNAVLSLMDRCRDLLV